MKENLMFQNAPHVRQSESVVTMMSDVILALLPIYLMSFFYHGARSLVLGLCGILSCVVFSVLGSIILREKPVPDLTPIITGLIIPLLMPADIPYYVVIAACSVAILVVKVPFGGTGSNLFNPAAVGFASVAICWPGLVFSYPVTMQAIEVFGESTAATAQSPAYSLAIGAVPDYEVLDMLLGSAPGPMGATNILVVAACGIFLIVRKAVNWVSPVFFLATYAALCISFPRIGGSAFDALCYELFSGMLVFGAFFMLTEPVTSPKRDFGKIMGAVASGIMVFLFRYFGEFEMGFASALIIMNVFSPLFDEACESVLHVYRHRDSIIRSFEAEKEHAKTEKKKKEPFARVLKIEKTAEEKGSETSEEDIIRPEEIEEIPLPTETENLTEEEDSEHSDEETAGNPEESAAAAVEEDILRPEEIEEFLAEAENKTEGNLPDLSENKEEEDPGEEIDLSAETEESEEEEAVQ